MESKSNYTKAISYVIDEQGKVIGNDLAHELASSVSGLNLSGGQVKVTGDPVKILETLVEKYSVLFGKISVEVSKDAIEHAHIQDSDLPPSLR